MKQSSIAISVGDRKIFDNIEAIFFDKDGTLEDSRAFLCLLAAERAKQIEMVVQKKIEDLLLATWGVKDRFLKPTGLMSVGRRYENKLAAAAILASKGYGWYEAKKIVHDAIEQSEFNVIPTKELCPMFPNIPELLDSLQRSRIKLGIISADSTSGIKRFVENENIDGYFDLLLGSDRDFAKPDPRLFLEACNILQVAPHKSLMIGDSVGDIQMAQQAGAAGTIGISWYNSETEHLAIADVIISELREIKLLKN